MWLYRASWLYRAAEICLGIALPSAFVPCLTAKSHMDNHVQSTPRPVPSSDYSSLFWFSSTACTALSRNSVCVISGHKIFFLIPSSPPGWKCTKQCEHLQDLCVTSILACWTWPQRVPPLEPALTSPVLWWMKLKAIPSSQQIETLRGIPSLFRWPSFCSPDLGFHLG